MLTRILLAIEPQKLRKQVRDCLQGPDILVDTLPRRAQLLRHIARQSGDLLIISEQLLPNPAEESIRTLRGLPDAPLVVILTKNDNPEEQALFTAAGCDAVLSTEIPEDAFEQTLLALLERRREDSPISQPYVLGPDDPRLADFDSQSSRMRTFLEIVRRVVPTNTTLLFIGETGVGKERLASAIHAEGPRATGPFVSVNCGALPETLLESELFGHEEGAFTGATRSRRGWFEVAHGGTVFLDEIGEMPHHLQVRLLRVLQAREVQRLGSERAIPIDVRIMAATNRDLEAEVEARRFRSDLFYRLSVVTLEIPPLRLRQEDIPKLVDTYINHFRTSFATSVDGIRPDALEALTRYSWPGNVRELVNLIERSMILCSGTEITIDDFPGTVVGQPIENPEDPMPGLFSESGADSLDAPDAWLKQSLQDVRDAVVADLEKRYLTAMLRETRGRVGEASERAGIDPRSLYNKMKKYGIDKKAFR